VGIDEAEHDRSAFKAYFFSILQHGISNVLALQLLRSSERDRKGCSLPAVKFNGAVELLNQ
jgi:hypothetical protein